MSDGLYEPGTRLEVISGHMTGKVLIYRSESSAEGDPEGTMIFGEVEGARSIFGAPKEQAVFASDVRALTL